MKISNNAPQHLSNHEVLHHFLSMKEDNDHLQQSIKLKQARDKALAKKVYPIEKDKDFPEDDPALLEEISEEETLTLDIAARRGMSDELIWIQDEVIRYLCSSCTPTARQTNDGIAKLADELQDHQLTKAEILQICNLAPSEPVELYAIIEEVDQRFQPDPQTRLDEIGSRVRETLLHYPPPDLLPYTDLAADQQGGEGGDGDEHIPDYVDAEMEAMAAQMEQEYIFEQGKEGGVDEEKEGDMD